MGAAFVILCLKRSDIRNNCHKKCTFCDENQVLALCLFNNFIGHFPEKLSACLKNFLPKEACYKRYTFCNRPLCFVAAKQQGSGRYEGKRYKQVLHSRTGDPV